MKLLAKGRVIKTQEGEKEEALTTFQLQREIEHALFNLAMLKSYLETGGGPEDFNMLRQWISDIKTLIDIFNDELVVENEKEQHALRVFKRYMWGLDAKDAEVWVQLGEFKPIVMIMEIEKFEKSFIRKGDGDYFKIGDEEVPIYMYALIPKRHYLVLVCEVLLRTAKKLGFLNVAKVKKPDVILGEPKEIKLPEFQTSGVGIPVTEVANNILYCLVEYVRSSNIKQKMSWLRTALAFLRAFTFNGRARARAEELLTEVEKVQRAVNWDIYEVAKGGYFELISDAEYREILEKLATLERIRDEVIDILLSLGIADVELAKLGEPVTQKN